VSHDAFPAKAGPTLTALSRRTLPSGTGFSREEAGVTISIARGVS
jgi:hypothetical protein